MKTSRSLIFGFLAVLFLAIPALAVPAQDGWDRKSEYNSYFNAKSMVYLSGEIVAIDRAYKPLPKMSEGFAVTVKTDDGKQHLVEVGPLWFTSFFKAKWDVKVGDKVDIRGSAVKINGQPVIMAVWGRKGDQEMTVRNLRGTPVWDFEVQSF